MTGRPRDILFGEALIKWVNTSMPDSMASHAKNVGELMSHSLLREAHLEVGAMVRVLQARGCKNSTCNRRVAVVKRVLNLAYGEWDMIDQPLAQKISKLSEKGLAREIYLSKDEVYAILSHMTNEEARKVCLLAAFTGLRRSEIMGLTPTNWRAPYIVLSSKTKSGKPRSVPVIEELRECVDLPWNLSYDQLRNQWESARKTAGRPDIWFHDLRHTFASWLAADPTIPMGVLRDLLGHSSLAVTSRYAHLRGNTAPLVEGALGGKHTEISEKKWVH